MFEPATSPSPIPRLAPAANLAYATCSVVSTSGVSPTLGSQHTHPPAHAHVPPKNAGTLPSPSTFVSFYTPAAPVPSTLNLAAVFASRNTLTMLHAVVKLHGACATSVTPRFSG